MCIQGQEYKQLVVQNSLCEMLDRSHMHQAVWHEKKKHCSDQLIPSTLGSFHTDLVCQLIPSTLGSFQADCQLIPSTLGSFQIDLVYLQLFRVSSCEKRCAFLTWLQ